MSAFLFSRFARRKGKSGHSLIKRKRSPDKQATQRIKGKLGSVGDGASHAGARHVGESDVVLHRTAVVHRGARRELGLVGAEVERRAIGPEGGVIGVAGLSAMGHAGVIEQGDELVLVTVFGGPIDGVGVRHKGANRVASYDVVDIVSSVAFFVNGA